MEGNHISKPKPVKDDGYPVDTGDCVKWSGESASNSPFCILSVQLSHGRTWKETSEDIMYGIIDFAIEFLKGRHEFQQML